MSKKASKSTVMINSEVHKAAVEYCNASGKFIGHFVAEAIMEKLARAGKK